MDGILPDGRIRNGLNLPNDANRPVPYWGRNCGIILKGPERMLNLGIPASCGRPIGNPGPDRPRTGNPGKPP